MILVMIVHANFRALPYPTVEESFIRPISSLLRFGTESIAIVCVNTFILLSGWYGIHFRIKRLLEFLFQILFFSLICTLFVLVTNKDKVTFEVLFRNFFLVGKWNYWFVKSYLCLYLFSPILNCFVEKCNKKEYAFYLLLISLFYFVYGFITDGANWFAHGYSGLSFIILYLISRYLSVHKPVITAFNIYVYPLLFISIAFANTTIAYFSTLYGYPNFSHKIYYYSNPLIILQAISLVLFFSKISLKSYFVNWIAISCFSIYLIHSNSYIAGPYYDHIILGWYYSTSNTFLFLIKTIMWITLFFISSILLDKIRIFLWSKIITRFSVL